MASRRWLGIGAGIVALGVLFLLALALVPILFAGRITAWVNQQLDDQLAADVSLSGVDVSLLSTFPKLGVKVRDLKIVNNAEPFVGEELFGAEQVVLGLDLMSVVSGDRIEISKIGLVKPRIRVLVDEEGRTNTDVTKGGDAAAPADASSSGSYDLNLDDVEIEDLELVYDDRQGGTSAVVHDLDTRAQIVLDGDLAKVTSASSIAALSATAGGVQMLREAALDATVDLVYDTASGKATFGDNRIALNALGLHFAGTVWPKEDGSTELALTFDTPDNGFRSLLSLVPAAYGDSFAGLKAGGTLALAGKVEGTYASTDDSTTYPAFDVDVAVKDGSFQYPDLPTGVDRVEVQASLVHPGGKDLDALVVDVPKLGLTAAGAPFDARIHVTHPMTDPDLDAEAHGTLDLAALRAALPEEAGAAPPSGKLVIDASVAGRMSDFQAANVDAVKAEGTVKGTEIRYVSEGWPDILVHALDLSLGPAVAELHRAELGWDDSDVAVTGKIEGILPYVMTDDGVLSGSVAVSSRKMDLRPFQGDDEAAPAAAPEPAPDSSDEALVAVPTNVSLTTELTVGKLITSSFEMTDVVGALKVADGAVRMDPLKATMLGGRVTLEGGYAAPTAQHADLDVAVTGFELQIDETLATFDTMAKLLPLLQGVAGKYDTALSAKIALAKDGTPDLASLASAGMFAPMGASLRPDALKQTKKELGKGFETVSVDGAKVQYAFDDGTIRIQPFQAKLGGVPTKFSGKVGALDRTLDLVGEIQVPTKLLQGAPILGQASKAAGGNVDVGLRIRGTYDAPKVSVTLGGVDEIVDAVVDQVKEEAGKVVDDLVAEARRQGDALIAAAQKEADRLRAEAKKSADKLRADAKKQGDKLVKDAGNNPIKAAAAKEGAKQLNNQADKAADKVVAEADKAADKVVAEAKAQKDKLISQAEAKAKAALK
ncbi:MAG: AsmA family protein [Myxococcota bacterium]